MSDLPLMHLIDPTPDAAEAFRRLSALPHCVWLDSAQPLPTLGRYSYLAVDPVAWHECRPEDAGGWRWLAEAANTHATPAVAGLPPFQGGVAGVLSYELGRSLERLPTPRFDEFQSPGMAAGLYDVVLAFDHAEGCAWVISQGLPETEPGARRRRAEQRLEQMLGWLEGPAPESDLASAERLAIERLAPQHAVEALPGVASDFSRDAYLTAVARVVEYIHAGDAFQVNLSQRLLHPAGDDPAAAYLSLRERNPAPFAGYLDLGESRVMSASPERFLAVRDRRVETRPIKGTRRRSRDATEDRRLADELLAHEKDRAENVMIVDLLRNDLSRVCEAPSVVVPRLCELESYRHVHHLVSVVEGTLAAGRTPVDLLRASFPGGSITGAPKVRAMEIIAELEPTARGPYCGSLYWLGLGGGMDSSILIRTLVESRGWVQAPVGGGIVADSDPESEYEETLHKAAGLIDLASPNALANSQQPTT
ncbi:MAG: aminodeoxychorismate synthase component I [Planctomycetota bacterium]